MQLEHSAANSMCQQPVHAHTLTTASSQSRLQLVSCNYCCNVAVVGHIIAMSCSVQLCVVGRRVSQMLTWAGAPHPRCGKQLVQASFLSGPSGFALEV